ncbi:hypothetical protein B0H19DRAFT_1080925 [Mycena capillaripes]|nr:hypothetical protein B0H19DRAFT_1080925 [Mycena capillaripes]
MTPWNWLIAAFMNISNTGLQLQHRPLRIAVSPMTAAHEAGQSTSAHRGPGRASAITSVTYARRRSQNVQEQPRGSEGSNLHHRISALNTDTLVVSSPPRLVAKMRCTGIWAVFPAAQFSMTTAHSPENILDKQPEKARKKSGETLHLWQKLDVKLLLQESRECPDEDIVGCSVVHRRCYKDLKAGQLPRQPKCSIFTLVLLVFDNVKIDHTFDKDSEELAASSDFMRTEAVVFRDQ